MLKFLFSALLLANIGLFSYQKGYLEALLPSGREPTRESNQLNADKVRVVPPQAPASTFASVAVAASALKKSQADDCTEVGNFTAEEAGQFEEALAALSLGDRLSQHRIREVVSHIVYIPPQGGKEGADKKASELRGLGIEDFYIIQDNSAMRWGISLGVFKQEASAHAHLADLNRKGVRSARIVERSVTSRLVAFQLRDLNPDMKAGVDKVLVEFPKHEVRGCGAA